jgi:predicted nucleic-acid-binding protein
VNRLVQLAFEDMLIVQKNQKGVQFIEHWITDEVIAKVCTSCNSWKFIDEFNKAGKGYVGTHSLCKPCHRKRNRELRLGYKADAEHNAEVTREIAQGRIVFDSEEIGAKSLTAYIQVKEEPPVNVKAKSDIQEAMDRVLEEQARADAVATRRMWF